jgi:hypothetical protein
MDKNEMKIRISFALRDPVLQQGFECICKENADLKIYNEKLYRLINAERKRQEECDDIHLQRITELEKENAKLKAQIEKMKCCGNCAKNGHICVAEEMQGKLCGKNKDKWELKR